MESAPRTRRLAQVALLAIGGCVLSFFLLLDDGYVPLDYRRQLAEDETPSTRELDQDRGKPWYKDIDYDVDFPCGPRKCFFPSKSDPERGYLVGGRKNGRRWHSSRRRFRDFHLHRLQEAHDLVTNLESEYGVRHLDAAAPFVEKRVPQFFLKRIKRVKRGRFPPGALLEVQPSLTEPEGACVFKCQGGKFQSKNENKERRRRMKTPGYAETLLEGVEQTIDLVKAVPCLAKDFEVMVDGEGKVWQVEVDRTMQLYESTSLWKRRTQIRAVPHRDVRGVVACLEDAADGLRKSIKEG